MPRRQTESMIQRAVWQHIQRRAVPKLVVFHVPNGGKRGPREARAFKAMGVVPGVSDFILLHAGKFFALELKAPGGRPTESQLEFLSQVSWAGGYSAICEGQDRALAVLENWGLLRGT